MRSLFRDLGFGFRVLLGARGFAAVAIVTLALGVGASSAIFSVVNGVLLNGLPWAHPESIVSFEVHKLKKDSRPRSCTPAQLHDWKAQLQSFSDLAALRWEQAYLTDRDEPYLAIAPRVSANALTLAGVIPLLGRGFEPGDGVAGARPVALIGERLWNQRYGGDRGLIGREIKVNGEPTTVIGVMAAARWFPWPQSELVLPLSLDDQAPSRSDDRLGVIGRLKPGVSLQQAQTEIDVVMPRLAQQYPTTDADLSVLLQLTRERLVGASGRSGVFLLMGAVGFVLLIVCANLANLLLARATARTKEIATRAAIGASRGQIVRQLLAECAAIGLLALPLSLLVTRVCLDYFVSLAPSTVTYLDQMFRFDRAVFGFALAITAATIVLFGSWPALKASNVDLNTSLKEGGDRGGTAAGSQRLRLALVVFQLGLALSLLVSASLFIQAFAKVSHHDAGFRLEGAIAAAFVLPDARYGNADKLLGFQHELETVLAGLPGNARAAIASDAPLDWGGPFRDFQIMGRETSGREEEPRARWSSVSVGYFSVLGLPVLSGRGFTNGDRSGGQPVAVISRSLADKFFAGQSPIGQRLKLPPLDGFGAVSDGVREIIGVVADVTTFNGLQPPEAQPRIYEPELQQPTNQFQVVVRADSDALTAGADMRRRIEHIDAQLGAGRVESMETRFDRQLWQGRFFYKLMAILGMLALILAAIGVYGVVSYSTARRTREFGIRTALGAEPGQIASLVLRKSLVLAASGLSLGVALSLLIGGALQKLLYDVSPRDPATLAGVSAVLLIVTLLASLVPTLRATRANPMQSLRTE